ncbi:hypothetical protein CPB84DRAFT_1963145 [Gymnopilus junonius]|uniref:Uncharacterized protein n=1 Tax=Gymnopilus junonius TaxID=109634 RepID=A0A9P5TL13_GYMJU|nr:hypothetical protein CPB84DRAFT_1963145 [Gymnopilus junonius]
MPGFHLARQHPVHLSKVILFASLLVRVVSAEIWCGKNYREGQPVAPPQGVFPSSVQLQTPEFAFKCLPRVQPYLERDNCSSASVIVDTSLTSVHFRHSVPLPSESFVSLNAASSSTSLGLILTVGVEDHNTSYQNTEFDVKNLELPLSLCSLLPRREPYSITCTAKIRLFNGTTHTYNYTSSLLYLPTPGPGPGSVTKLDRKTGALMTHSGNDKFEPIFPIGFYTDFGYLASNLTILDEIKSQGFNMIHPVPPFHNEVTLDAVLHRLDEIGLFLVYDMRHSYQDLTSIAQEVKSIMNHRSLLLWYTADEPDGPGDPLDATQAAYNLIYSLDGYHPVSAALNCADYYFEEYASGADIILPDVYMIGNNVNFSLKYNTPCTKDFGCCGCDNCQGHFDDISNRLDKTIEKLGLLGWDSTKFIWAVPQAFGGEEFWTRVPTGREWLLQALLSINHKARGIMPWIDPTPKDIKRYASRLAQLLPQLTPFFFGDDVKFSRVKFPYLDVGTWRKGRKSLIIATNLNPESANSDLRVDGQNKVDWILQEGVSLSITGHIIFEPMGSAIFLNSIVEDEPLGHVHDEF